MRLPPPLLTRRGASAALFLPWLFAHDDAANAAVVFSSGAEAGMRAASLRPGYGPPDGLFPPVFRGRWTVRSTIVEVRCPQGDENAPADELATAGLVAAASKPLIFEARFIDIEGSGGVVLQNEGEGVALATRQLAGGVIADRGFNAERRSMAISEAVAKKPLADSFSSKWDATFPNVLVLTSEVSVGVTEIKVIKRLTEEPYDGAFGTSEFARYTTSGAAGDLKAAPTVLAQRVQTKYKWDPPAPNEPRAVKTIEAIELAVLASGFGDPSGATPLLVVKSRLIFSKA